jgi:hypothetical protein
MVGEILLVSRHEHKNGPKPAPEWSLGVFVCGWRCGSRHLPFYRKARKDSRIGWGPYHHETKSCPMYGTRSDDPERHIRKKRSQNVTLQRL